MEKTKICEICGEKKPRHQFINIKGIDDNYCITCMTEMICKSCGKIDHYYKFLKNGIVQQYCLYCREEKKCLVCGNIKPRYDFYWKGTEFENCNSCMFQFKTCEVCGNYFPYYKLIDPQDKENEICPNCRKEVIKCKSCSKYKNTDEFIKNGVKHKICNYCRQQKRCNSCGNVKHVFAFFINGIEYEECISCKQKLKYNF